MRCGAVSTRKQAASVPMQRTTSPGSGLLGDTAVVIGASVAGLLSACALARHYSSVVVIDKDTLLPGATPSDGLPSPRRGVPQSSQPHVMLTKGFQLMNSFIPTLHQDLLDAGALPVDWLSANCKVGAGGGWLAVPERKAGASKMVSVTTSRGFRGIFCHEQPHPTCTCVHDGARLGCHSAEQRAAEALRKRSKTKLQVIKAELRLLHRLFGKPHRPMHSRVGEENVLVGKAGGNRRIAHAIVMVPARRVNVNDVRRRVLLG